jgi:NADPH:quinone reductase-like Zn-dependent oxidoreductase
MAPRLTLRLRLDDRRIIAGPAAVPAEDVRLLEEFAAAGKFKPVIDRQYPFDQMAEAHRYVDQGHRRSKVVMTLIRGE